MSLQSKREPGIGESLLAAFGILVLFTWMFAPRERVAHLVADLMKAETLSMLAALSIVYACLSLGSWLHRSLSLRTPGRALSALRNEDVAPQPRFHRSLIVITAV